MNNIIPNIKPGFPNLAEDAAGLGLELQNLLIQHPVSTYYLRVEGDSMLEAGIKNGDIAVVDRSLQPRSGDIVVAVVDSEFKLMIFQKSHNLVSLSSKPGDQASTQINDEVHIWGVVTYAIHKTRP